MPNPSGGEPSGFEGLANGQTGSQSNSSKTLALETQASSSEHRTSNPSLALPSAVVPSHDSSMSSPQPGFSDLRQSEREDRSVTSTTTSQNSSYSQSALSSSRNHFRDSFQQIPLTPTSTPGPFIARDPSTNSLSSSSSKTQTPSSSLDVSRQNTVRAGSSSSKTSATETSSYINVDSNLSPGILAASNQSSEFPVQRSQHAVDNEAPSFKSDNVKRVLSTSDARLDPMKSFLGEIAEPSNAKNGDVAVSHLVKERFVEHEKTESDAAGTPLSIRDRILNFEKFENNQLLSNKQSPSPSSDRGKPDSIKNLANEAVPLDAIPWNNLTLKFALPHSQDGGEDGRVLPPGDDLQNATKSLEIREDQALPSQVPDEIQAPLVKIPPPLSLPSESLSADQHKKYTGYNPKTTADFIVQSAKAVSRNGSDILSLVPGAPVPVDSRTRCPIAIPAVIAFVLIGIILVPFAVTPAVCRLGVCGRTDRSSLSTSKYLFQTFEFSAPLGFLLIPTTIQLFCLAFLFVLFRLLVGGSVPVPPLATMAAHIHYAVFKLFYYVVTAIGIISFPMFILSGLSSSWTTAVAFIFGLVPTVISPYVALVATTRATSRLAANYSASIFEAYTHAARAAAVVPLTSLALTLFSLILCYNAVRDVRALVGFILGTALPTLLIRISVAVFANFPRPLASSRFHPDDVRNPAAPLPAAAAHLTCVAGNAAQLCATFATPIVSAAILASSLPYFEKNPLAMCVQNHLDIDRVCVAYSALKVKFSIAIELCRLGNFYNEYPSLTDRESVGSLVAAPFVLAVSTTTLALGVGISTLRAPSDPRGRVNLSEAETHVVSRRRLIPFLGPFLMKTFISVLVMLVVTGLLVILSAGPISPFYHGNDAEIERYVLPETSDVSHRCTPRDSPEIGLLSTEFPRLELETGRYRPINGFGERLPIANEVAWRIFICTIFGLLSGILIGTVSGVVSSSSHRGARRAAAVADDGLGSDVVVGIGVGSIVGAMAATVVTFLTLICYHLFGGFGVGICAVGMTYAVGMVGVTDIIGLITKESLRLSATCGATEEELRGTRLLCVVGESIQGCGRSVCNASSLMGTISLLWVLIENTGVIPSPREVIDDKISVFTRHITDVDRVNFLDRGILPATIFGLMLPFLLCAMLILTACRVSDVIGRAVRNEMLKRGPWEGGEHGDYDRCVRVNLRVALVESMVVFSAAIIGTTVGALWFGRRGWIAMAIGAIASGNILSLCSVVAGTRVEGMRLFRVKLTGKKDNETKAGDRETRKWTWEEIGAEWISGCVTALLLFITSSGTVAVRVIPPDGTWWVGFIICGAWVLTLMAASAIIGYVAKEADLLPDDVVGVDQYDVRVNRDVQSPFYEEGPRIDRSTMNRQSVLRHVETGDPTQLDPLSA